MMSISNTPTAELDGVDAQAVDELDVLVTTEGLCHDVRQHVFCGHILEGDVVSDDLLTEEVMEDVDMLAARVVLRVFC